MLDAIADQYSIRFTAEPLREMERRELVAQGRTDFDDLFANIRFAMGSGFGTKVRSSARSTRAIICVPTKIHATIPEVAEVFFSDRTNAAIGFAQSQAIYNFLEPSADHPLRSCGLRWSLWHSPSKLIRQRDICYIEYMDTFVDENGRRGWARCTHSIHHRSCPPLVNSHNIVRAHLGCSGTIYTESDTPGVLDVITLYDCDTKGVPAWMTKFVALRKAKNAHLLEHLIRLARAANDSLVADFTKIEPQKPEKACFGCGDVLPKWSVAGQRKCRECHEPLCKSCNDIVYCAIEGGKKLNRICMHCVDRFLSEGGSERRIDMYTDSSSQRSGRGGSPMTPGGNKFSRKGSDASSHRSTKRLSSSSHSGSTTDGAGLESPTPLLEDKPTPPIYSYQQPPQVQQQQRHHQQPQIPVQAQVQLPRPQSQSQQRHHRHHRHPQVQPPQVQQHHRHHHQPQVQPQAQQQHQQRQQRQTPPPQVQQHQQSVPHVHLHYVPVPLAPKESPALINLGVSRYKAKKSGDVDLSYLSNFVNARS